MQHVVSEHPVTRSVSAVFELMQLLYLYIGVPKIRRGEVWLLLSHQYRLRHKLPQRQLSSDTPYHDLLKQLTAQQHAILVDLGEDLDLKRDLCLLSLPHQDNDTDIVL